MALDRNRHGRIAACSGPTALRLARETALIVACLCLVCALPVGAQPAPPKPEEKSEATRDSTVTLNFPQSVPLETVISYVSARLEINIIYDEAQVNQRVTLKTPAPLPMSALLDLLRSVLQTKSLALEATEVEGMWRIVPSQGFSAGSHLAGDSDVTDASAVTTVFSLKHARPDQVTTLVAPFLTKPGGQATPVADGSLVIVTDYASNIDRIRQLIEMVDAERQAWTVRMRDVTNMEATELLQMVQPLLKADAAAAGDPQGQSVPMVIADPRINRLVMAGTAPQLESLETLVASLDASVQTVRQVYRPLVIGPQRLDAIIKSTFDPGAMKRYYRSVVDDELGLLIVSAQPAMHAQIDQLLADVDVAAPGNQQPVRFYKLRNTLAQDVLTTLKALEGDKGLSASTIVMTDAAPAPPFDPPSKYLASSEDPAVVASTEQASAAPPAEAQPANALSPVLTPASAPPPGAMVTADTNTNSIIVIGTPEQQRLYEGLILQLDQRRPQVLLETTIVTLDTSNDFRLGVDIGRRVAGADGEIIAFSSFGVSSVDPTGGSLTPVAGSGGTFALLAPDVADVVIRAIATDSHARLVSMPRVLVNDNEQAVLDSINLEPYENIVVTDRGDIIGEGGTAEAGTRIEMTPNISEGHYLQLTYSIELSTFTGTREPNLPPPSQSNTVSSRVTIPDGHTIIVGGLNRREFRDVVSKVPLLGNIPYLGYLFKTLQEQTQDNTLFVFIRPTIMEHDRFLDLMYQSDRDRDAADIGGDYPASEPQVMELRS